MKDNKYLVLLCAALCGIPFFLNTPYILQAWTSSPLDTFDIIFVPLAVFVLAATIVRMLQRGATRYFNKRALFFLIPVVGLLGTALYMHINAALILLSIAFWWLSIWYLLGWEIAWHLVAGFGILSLITVSSTFWICYFTGCDVTTVRGLKIAVSGAFIALAYSSVERGFRPRIRAVFAIILAAGATFAAFEYKAHARSFRPFSPEISPKTEGYIGRQVEADPMLQRFFRTSDARYFRFANEDGQLSALQVYVGDNIHEIHPAALCLRSGGWQIISEKPYEATLGDKTIQVSEINARSAGTHMLVWVWFSSDTFSTGSFIAFRRHTGLNKGTNWRTYQISAPLVNDDIDAARARLLDFLGRQRQWLGGELHDPAR